MTNIWFYLSLTLGIGFVLFALVALRNRPAPNPIVPNDVAKRYEERSQALSAIFIMLGILLIATSMTTMKNIHEEEVRSVQIEDCSS